MGSQARFRPMKRRAGSSPRRGEAGTDVTAVAKVLEIGIVVTLGVVVAAAGAYVISDVVGRARRSQRNRTPHPPLGSVPPSRHQNIAVASPR
ncbi:MAG: hypothetical protein ACREM1_11130 [Longimicrobiales bacterium]